MCVCVCDLCSVCCADRLYSKVKPLKVDYGMGIEEHDLEGRLITCEYDNFYFITACEFYCCVCICSLSMSLFMSSFSTLNTHYA